MCVFANMCVCVGGTEGRFTWVCECVYVCVCVGGTEGRVHLGVREKRRLDACM